MFEGREIADLVADLGYSHVVWLPDSAIGPWETALEQSPHLQLVRVCREGEAWMIAAGLHLGGADPLVMMQTTGLFESGDALRNAVFDFGLPLTAVIGARSWLVEDSPDTARRFALPVLAAWEIPHVLVAAKDEKPRLREHLSRCRQRSTPGFVLIGEGRM